MAKDRKLSPEETSRSVSKVARDNNMSEGTVRALANVDDKTKHLTQGQIDDMQSQLPHH